jgi:hypothetical protein
VGSTERRDCEKKHALKRKEGPGVQKNPRSFFYVRIKFVMNNKKIIRERFVS